MAKAVTKSPRATVKVRRLPVEGDSIRLEAKVARVSRDGSSDVVTLHIPGYTYPVTIRAEFLPEE
jgi:hypothetical protein